MQNMSSVCTKSQILCCQSRKVKKTERDRQFAARTGVASGCLLNWERQTVCSKKQESLQGVFLTERDRQFTARNRSRFRVSWWRNKSCLHTTNRHAHENSGRLRYLLQCHVHAMKTKFLIETFYEIIMCKERWWWHKCTYTSSQFNMLAWGSLKLVS